MVVRRFFRRCCLPAALFISVCCLSAIASTGAPVPAAGASRAVANALATLASPDGSEIEPNNTCATAQNLGAVALPFSIRGSLDTPPEVPDVDYFLLAGPAGARWQADLEGALTGQGTLPDPRLGLFDSACNRIYDNDGFYSLECAPGLHRAGGRRRDPGRQQLG